MYAYVYSAGVGRTGTFIALDYLLEQAKVEGELDVYGYACIMRSNRVNMIQTLVSVFCYKCRFISRIPEQWRIFDGREASLYPITYVKIGSCLGCTRQYLFGPPMLNKENLSIC